jgi:hypothetical protein
MVRSTPRRICWPVSFTDAVRPRTSRNVLPDESAAATWEERRRVWKETELGGAWRRRIGRNEEGDKRGDEDETAAAARGSAMWEEEGEAR